LYVIASRAKKNIYFFSERGRTYRENWDTYDCYPTKQLFYNKNVIYDN
jgi:DNA helicase-2/ATP-dependent DNA helicase PcrA